MNREERKYADYLELRRRAGEILDWKWEPCKLRTAYNTFYKIDFWVITEECIECHEFKGHWEDDARVKWKDAGEIFYFFRFLAIQRKGAEWVFEEYGNRKKWTVPIGR